VHFNTGFLTRESNVFYASFSLKSCNIFTLTHGFLVNKYLAGEQKSKSGLGLIELRANGLELEVKC